MKASSKPTVERASVATVAKAWKAYGMSLLPGVGLTAGIAGIALFIGQAISWESLNPLLISVLLGVAWRQVIGLPPSTQAGVKFAMKRILRLAVILLGLRLSLAEVLAVGPVGLLVITTSTVSTFYLTCWLGQRLGMGRRLTQLIAAGTSICGASAVVATNAVVDGSEEEMTYAIATITGCGTLAMLTYPLVADLFRLTPQVFGIWCGASVHEVAQVIATAFQRGSISGDLATVTKLSRVLLIIPIMLGLGWQANRSPTGSSQPPRPLPIPWFVVLFGVMLLLNSTGLVPGALKHTVLTLNQGFLCMSLAAMGLETNLARLSQLGMQPLYLAGLSWLFLAVISLGLITVL